MSSCPTCQDDFSEFKVPKMLPCGDTCCLICIYEHIKQRKPFICQECSQVYPNPSILEKQPINNAVLQLVKQLKVQKALEYSPSHIFSQNSTNTFHDTQDTIAFSSPIFEGFQNFSPSQGESFPSSDSFNFDPFKMSLDSFTNSQEMFPSFFTGKKFYEPRKDLNKSLSRKINDIEICEKGVFREKISQETPEVCEIKSCDNPRMFHKGSFLPFCACHTAQFNPSLLQENLQTPENFFKSQSLTQPGPLFTHKPMPIKTPSVNQNQRSFPESKSNTLFNTPSTQNSLQSFPKFGKTTPLDFVQSHQETPARIKTPSGNNRLFGMRNSSIFSGIGLNENQGNNFVNPGGQKMEEHILFPEMQQTPHPNQQCEPKNKCIVPNCPNERRIQNGEVWLVCGNKCLQKLKSFPKNA